MNIEKLNFHALRNEQHYQLHTEFKELVEQETPKKLKIEKEFAEYLPIYKKEDDTLKVIRKSAITESVTDADTQRDISFRGLADAVKVATQHFKPEIADAAKRVKIIFDTYGNVTRKPYDEESAAITNILQELQGKYAEDMTLMNLTEWVAKLEQDNNHFLSLVKDRYDDLNLDIISHMPQVRKEIDEKLRTITTRIDALIIVEGEEVFKPFVESYNQRIKHYKNVLLQREGMNKKEEKKLES